jgi:hypothetical protein
VDDAFHVCALQNPASFGKQLQPSSRAQSFSISVVGIRTASDQFHDKIRSPAVCCASVEHAGDIGMINHSQRLPLRLEAGK